MDSPRFVLYAKDRAGLYQTLATTLEHYNINLVDAATGTIDKAPEVPGLIPAQDATVTVGGAKTAE